jgi:hypothetical protein
MKSPKSKAVILICLVLSLSGCSGLQTGNKNELSEYESALISRENFSLLNNQAVIDEENSFATSIDNSGQVTGDQRGIDFLQWGESELISPKDCSYENFWSKSVSSIANSNRVIGLVTNFHTSELSSENYQKTRASILGQYSIVFRDEETASKYFSAIEGHLKLCATGVTVTDFEGNSSEIFKEGPKKNFNYYRSGENVLLRTGFDELLVLDFFVKTRFSISLVKIFVNDLNLPQFDQWSIFFPFIQGSMNQICKLEDCTTTDMAWNALQPFVPNPNSVENPDLA